MKDSVDFRSDTLECPYCGEEVYNAWEFYIGDNHLYECDYCKKDFEFDVEDSVVYTTYKINTEIILGSDKED